MLQQQRQLLTNEAYELLLPFKPALPKQVEEVQQMFVDWKPSSQAKLLHR